MDLQKSNTTKLANLLNNCQFVVYFQKITPLSVYLIIVLYATIIDNIHA